MFLSATHERPARVRDLWAVALGVLAYAMLVLVDLATTTAGLHFFPLEARVVNGIMATIVETYGLAGLWVVKLAPALLVVAAYVRLRLGSREARVRKLADWGLLAGCVVQAAVVLVNVRGFVELAGAA